MAASSALRFQFLFNVKEGSTDVHCCSVTRVKYVYVNLYFYNMQIHLNLYSLTLLASVNTGCNILHENRAKVGLVSSFSVRPFVLPLSLRANPPSQLKKGRES